MPVLSRLAAIAMLAASAATVTAEPPRYAAVDITGWTAAQLDTLPFFKHLTINPPTGAGVPYGFALVSQTSSGYYAGMVDQGIPYAGNEAVLLSTDMGGDLIADHVEPFGTYSWGYWSCDSTDCHYYFGYVRDSTASDVNWSGRMVGRATIAGSGDYSSGSTYHGYRYDAQGGRIDLFPDDGSTSAVCINNRGEIGGTIFGVGTYRRAPDGTLTFLDIIGAYGGLSPRWMNADGVMIGAHYPSRAGVASGGAATFDLPDLGGYDTVTASDLNDSSWIVGKCGNFADPETFAIIWEPLGDGTWREYDLVEQLDTPGVLLESAVVIDNAGHIIATGHLDGTDLFGSRRYWLVPDTQLAGWCTPDIGVHPADVTLSGGDAQFSVVVVNAGDVTGYQWRADGIPIDAVQNPSAGTASLVIRDVMPIDSGMVIDCVVTSACGSTTSGTATLAVEAPSCIADLNGDGLLDLVDVNLFVGAFVGGDPLADLNDDGLLDLLDIGLFVNAFAAGCP
ncbi:MAG: hypothetical protein H6810_08775 [Phycisphaeraceae bacterium]|nr:MAG: hypothetical protein H6810_08775 [Phycisphaeraceae bacterium]